MSNNVYTHEERQIIVKYLVDHNIDGNLQGNVLWKRMEQEGVLNRTWQSMRTHFKTTIINSLHIYELSEYHYNMIMHGFGRKTRLITSQSAKSAPPKQEVPFSSDSDSDTTVCVAAQAKRPRRDSGSNTSLDLLTCNTTSDKRNASANANNQPSTSTAGAKTKHDIRSYMVSTAADTDIHLPTTSTPKAKHHKKRQRQHDDTVVILDSDDDQPVTTEVTEVQIEKENNTENEPFSLEEDTQLILFFKTHQCYLADIRNNFVYVEFNYNTPSSMRTPNELRTRFVEHIMPKLYTYDCITYEEMVTYYDRADIDVPTELQQIISKTVAEQKKNKKVAATKVTVDVSTQAEQRSSVDKMICTEVPDMELVLDNMIQEIVVEHDEHMPNPPDADAEAEVTRKPTMVDATTQVQPSNVDKICNRTMVDASTQVEQTATEDKACNTECQCQVNTSTQTQQSKVCNTDVTVQHVEFVTDNMLDILLPEHADRRRLQDLQNIRDKHSKSPKSAHGGRRKQYRVLNDKRYVDSSVRQSAIDECEAELSRLTGEVQRLQGTLGKLRGYVATEDVGDNKENNNAESNSTSAVQNERGTSVLSDMSHNTTIVSCTTECLSDSEPDVSVCTRGSQTVNQPGLMFDIFQAELDKNYRSTQMGGSSQDGEQEDNSTVISLQPDIEFSRLSPQPIEVIETSDESDDTDVPAVSAACQMEPLNLSTNSHESEDHVDVLSTNSDKFYSAVSQD